MKKQKKAKALDAATIDDLVARATEVRKNAHAPYSKYKVGAAILTKNGKVFAGCNVENASLGATICAERGAVMQMIAAGEDEPVACAVVTKDGGSPCGMCRQVLSEFASAMPIVIAATNDPQSAHVVDLAELLPRMFELR